MLIALYGINNIGKSTHAKRLVDRLKKEGHDAVYVKYPVYDVEPTGPFLNSFLRSSEAQNISEEELQLWFTLNRYQFEPTLRDWLAEGKIVIAEDYIGTGITWGTLKGAKTEWLETMNEGLIKEDFSILMDGERFLIGKEKDHLHEGNDDLMKRSRQVHLDLAKRYDWTVVPVSRDLEETASLIWNLVEQRISR